MSVLTGRTLGAIALITLESAVGPRPAGAQEVSAGDRITIMVPNLAPLNGANDNFGEYVAEELRDLISELHTHETVSNRDMRNARREFDLDTEDLYNCISARQLAMRQNWGLVMCGEYEELGDRQVRVNAKFVGSATGEEFAVPEFTALSLPAYECITDGTEMPGQVQDQQDQENHQHQFQRAGAGGQFFEPFIQRHQVSIRERRHACTGLLWINTEGRELLTDPFFTQGRLNAVDPLAPLLH